MKNRRKWKFKKVCLLTLLLGGIGLLLIPPFTFGTLGLLERSDKEMKALSYVLGTGEEIGIGKEYYFGQLWDGKGNGMEILESGVVYVIGGEEGNLEEEKESIRVEFEIVKNPESVEDCMSAIVEITDITE